MDIILYFLNFIKYQQKIICQLFHFICKYIPLKQWAFDDSLSPNYQKFKIDELPQHITEVLTSNNLPDADLSEDISTDIDDTLLP